MAKTLTEINRELYDLIGEPDFEAIKDFPVKDKETILKLSGAIETANTLGQCFWLGDKNHDTIYINKIYQDITGYTLEEFIKNKYKSDFTFTKESKETIAKHHLLRPQGISSQYEADILTKDGEIIPVLVHGAPTKDSGTIGIFTNLLSMDKLNREDQQLLEILGYKDFKIVKKKVKKEDQKMIIKTSPVIRIANAWGQGFWLGDDLHRTIYANPIYQKTTGYSLEECIGQQSDFCFDEESKQRIAENHKLRTKGISSQYEGTYITKKGSRIPVLIIGAPTETGGTHGIHINMTETRKLREAKQIADQIIRHSSEAIVVMDQNRRIKLWNAGAKTLFGYKEEEVSDKTMDFLIPENEKDSNVKLMQEVEKDNIVKNFEAKRLAKNKEILDVSVSISKVIDKRKNFIGYLITYRDISHQKKTSNELQKRFEAIQDAYKELGLQRRQNDYISEIVDMATSNADMESLCKLIVSAACMLTKADGTTLRIYEKKSDSLELIAHMGVDTKWQSKSKTPFARSIAQDAYKNMRPLIVQNINSNERHKSRNLVKLHKFQTLISIPLFIEKKYLGSLNLYSKDPSKFRMIEAEFLEQFGKECSLSIYAKLPTHP